MLVNFVEFVEKRVSKQKQIADGKSRVLNAVILVAVSICVLRVGVPLVGFLGPLLFERTISVSNVCLQEIPERFHPHFSPNAASISGEYSDTTRQCLLTYSCTEEDYEAFIERERTWLHDYRTHEDGTLSTGRQWGPGVASYVFDPASKTATVHASAF